MLAKDARKLAEDNNYTKESQWWMYFKDTLFEAIKNKSLEGNFELIITDIHTLNQKDWIKSKSMCEIVKKDLEELGYTFKHYEDISKFEVIIKW